MCEIDFDGEYSSVWHEPQVRARKPHTCSCCGMAIPVGHLYTDHRSLYDGHWTRDKMCAPCHAAREVFARADGHRFMAPSDFLEHLYNCVDGWDVNDPWRPMLNAIRKRMGKEPLAAFKHDDDEDDGEEGMPF